MRTTIVIDKKIIENANKQAKKDKLTTSAVIRILLSDYINDLIEIKIKKTEKDIKKIVSIDKKLADQTHKKATEYNLSTSAVLRILLDDYSKGLINVADKIDTEKKVQKTLKKITSFKKVVIGISGGADSVALTYLLKETKHEIILAHLNHNLRKEESNKDEQFVKNLAKKLNITCITESKKIPNNKNLENNAREIRYEFLEKVRQKYNAKFIAVGHHKDDQIETILMHKKRGAGLRGLQGMNYQKDKIIRPLLDISKKEILNFLKKNNIKYRTDESNFDTKYERNKLRHEVIPKLKKENSNFEKDILKEGKNAEKKLKIISKKAKIWIKKQIINNQFQHQLFSKLNNDLKSEIIIQLLGQKDLYRKNIDQLINFINKGKTGKKIEIKGTKILVEYKNVIISHYCRDAINRVSTEICTSTKTQITKTDTTWHNYKISSTSKEKLFVRSWKKGDKFSPTGMTGTKKLQDFFTDKKIPRNKRKTIPIIVDKDDNILSIADLRYDKKGIKLKDDIVIENLTFLYK